MHDNDIAFNLQRIIIDKIPLQLSIKVDINVIKFTSKVRYFEIKPLRYIRFS